MEWHFSPENFKVMLSENARRSQFKVRKDKKKTPEMRSFKIG